MLETCLFAKGFYDWWLVEYVLYKANVSCTVSNAYGDKIKLNYSVFSLSRDN